VAPVRSSGPPAAILGIPDAAGRAVEQRIEVRADLGGRPRGKGAAHAATSPRGPSCPHWTRDVTFREDHSKLRTGAAPRALASFRNLTLNTYRLAGRANIAHARRDLHDRADTFAVYGI